MHVIIPVFSVSPVHNTSAAHTIIHRLNENIFLKIGHIMLIIYHMQVKLVIKTKLLIYKNESK